MEDVFYDFHTCDIGSLLSKKTLGGRTPIPLKPPGLSYLSSDCEMYGDMEPYFQETMDLPESFEELSDSSAEEKPNPFLLRSQKEKIEYQKNIFRKKYYIRPNQECPICLEPILTKKTACLTVCGHGFHKQCIHRAFELKWLTKQAGISCPLCRHGDISEYNVEKYCPWNSQVNELDGLENFWFCKDTMLATPCYDGSHYMGLDKNCIYCKKYRIIKKC